MGTQTELHRRADARRNRERILAVATDAFSEFGPNVPSDDIARRAEISPATLFRHFANRDALVAAVVEQRFADEIEPVMERALRRDDPWKALVDAIGAAVRVGTTTPGWRSTLALAREAGLVSEAARERFRKPAGVLLRRAQDAGVVRADVDVRDIAPIVRMLRAVATDTPGGGRSWQHYLTLLLRADEA